MRRIVALLCAAALTLAVAPSALAAAPSNDDRATPVVITELPFTDTLDTTEATGDPADPRVPWMVEAGIYPEATVWYSYTAAFTGMVNVYTGESSYLAGMLLIDPAQAEPAWGSSGFGFSTVLGTTYEIAFVDVESYDGGPGGTLNFTVTRQPMEETVLAMTLTGVELVAGELQVSGTTTVLSGAIIGTSLIVDASQRGGRVPPAGNIVVPDPALEWTAAVPASTGVWKAGNVTLTVRYWYTDEMGDGWVDGQFTVRVPRVRK